MTALRMHTVKLAPSDQVAFDRMVERLGMAGAARELGVTAPSVERLRDGGSASPPLVEKVRAALARVVTGGG